MGVFANTLSLALQRNGTAAAAVDSRRGLVAWLLARLRRRTEKKPRLTMVERISLAPRQTIALIEADGQRLLVATSSEGAPVFFRLKPAAACSTEEEAGRPDEEGRR